MGGEGASHQCPGDEASSTQDEHHPSQHCRSGVFAHEWQHWSDGLPEEGMRHSFQSDVQFGTRDHMVVRASLVDTFDKVHTWEEECFGGSPESPRPGPSHPMVSSSSRI